MIWRIILIAIAVYLAIVAIFLLRQSHIVYVPKRNLYYTPGDFGLPYQEIYFYTADQVKLHGWFIGDTTEPHAKRDTILFCHGNAGNISHRCETLAIFFQLGVNCFIFDYRGYGNSQGKPTEKGTYLDVSAAWKYLTKTLGIAPEQLILFGRSLGGAVVSQFAASPGVYAKAIILESTFTSIDDVGAAMYPWLPVRTLSRFKYNTLERLPGIHLPLLVIHSPQDDFIPYQQGKQLFEAGNPPKYFLEISGSHNEGYLESREVYFAGIRDFIASLPEIPAKDKSQ